jgi:DNA polymerase-3 subunit alpha
MRFRAFAQSHAVFGIAPTISIAALVKRQQQKMPAVAMTDHANLMGAFHFVRDIYHNKAASQNKAVVENGEEPTEVPMKPMWVEFFVCEDHKTNRLRITIPNSTWRRPKRLS